MPVALARLAEACPKQMAVYGDSMFGSEWMRKALT